MPFTFAHPAAAVPLLRPLGKYGSLSALAIGSIAPDLDFIVPIGLTREQTHGLAALFLFCLPAGALVYLLFHALFKAPLQALMPDAVANRFGIEAPRESWRAVLASLLCGAVTHLVWDAFTHPGTPVVNSLPVLRTELANFGGYRVYLFKLVQHCSSVIGLALLALWSFNWMQRTPPATVSRGPSMSRGWRIGALLALTGVPLLLGLYAGWRRAPQIANMVDLQSFAAGFVFTALPAAALLLLIYSVLFGYRKRAGF